MAHHEPMEHDNTKSKLLDIISHEIRTPLCIFKNIISNALAGTMGDVSEKLRDYLLLADKEIDRLAGILSDFIDISQIDDGKMRIHVKKFAIQSAVYDAIKSIAPSAAAKKNRLILEVPDSDISIEADYKRIVQVIFNLVHNAVKFTPEGGRITVQIKDLYTDIFIAVEDNGIGISEDIIDTIFNRPLRNSVETQLGKHGTRWGLAIVRSIVEMHGGHIWAESTLGRGSCFCFTLPKNILTLTSCDKTDQLAVA